jgi:enamine deaminase RidA (YjgF/YER057c/UK114 family)
MSAQMAIESDGSLIAAAKDTRQPRCGSRAQAQAEHIIENIEKLCRAAGTSLHNIVRVLQFHTDLDEFYPVYQVWERRLGGRPLPFSAVEVPAPLPTPGASLMIEAWAYAP